MAKDKNINTLFRHDLIKVDGSNCKASFRNLDSEQVSTLQFDALHVVPYMSPPEALIKSPLANLDGFVDVHINTLQHKKVCQRF